MEADIQALNTRADALRKELEALVQADADAFAPLAAAYGLPKDTPEQAAHKAAVLERRWMPPVPCHLRLWKSAPRALLWWKNTPPKAA